MKVILKNSSLFFSEFRLNNIGIIRSKSSVGALAFNGATMDAGDYYFNIDPTSTQAQLTIEFVVGASVSSTKVFQTSDFGKDVKVTVPSGTTMINYIGASIGEWVIDVKSTDGYTKIGELTAPSAYNNSRLMMHFDITAELEVLLSQYQDVYIRVSDSNNLFRTVNNINCFKYSGGATGYFANIPFSVIVKSDNVPDTNLYLQHNQNEAFTPSAGDTTMKVEFFYKNS